MKKTFIALFAFAFILNGLYAQKFSTRTGTVSFYAESTLKDAKAENHQARFIWDAGTQEMAVSLLIKSFEFEKALMQTHFNSDMESDSFTKATFLGKITNPGKISTTAVGTYEITVAGTLTIHGVSQKVQTEGTLSVKGGKVRIQGQFIIDCNDYGVAPRTGVDNNVHISIDATLEAA